MRNDQTKAPTKRRLGGGLLLPASAVDNFENAARVVAKVEGVECTLTRYFQLLGRNAPETLAKMALNGHGGEHSPPKSRRPGAFSAPTHN